MERMPLPEQVGRWGSAEEFTKQRIESGQWVFWEDRVEQVLAGDYHAVVPLHIEVSPTYLCNFACPWCSSRSAREDWAEEDVFNHPKATPLTVMRQPRLESVVDHLAEHGIEIMWVGGEPTMNPLLYPAVSRAAEQGLAQCLFTNGSLFKPEQAELLFNSGMAFIRVSLNAVTPEVHRKHHDYDQRKPYADRVLRNLEMLSRIRHERRSETMLAVSIVVDRNNVGDLRNTLTYLAELCRKGSACTIDYVMVRPAFPLNGAHIEVDSETVEQFFAETAASSAGISALKSAGIDLVIPESSVGGAIEVRQDNLGCLAAGWFGEVTPSGDMLPCSDLYGDPEYFIGNIGEQSIEQIWGSAQRSDVLERVRTNHCVSKRCPANGRGHHLNRVFREVERYRDSGNQAAVRDWITGLRTVLPAPKHSFFL